MNSLQSHGCNPAYRGLHPMIPYLEDMCEGANEEAELPLELPPCENFPNCVATGENNPRPTFSPIEIPKGVSHNYAVKAVQTAMDKILWQDLNVPYSIFGSKRIQVVNVESNKLVYEYQTFFGTTSELKINIRKNRIDVLFERIGGDSSSLMHHLFLHHRLFSYATYDLVEKATKN